MSARCAPPLATGADSARNVWGAGSGSQLAQVAERASDAPVQELTIPAPAHALRPKSMDFSGLANSLRSPRLSTEIEDDFDFDTAVTGATAIQIDVSDQLGKALVPFGIFVVGLSIILLMMVFRSVAVPIKATGGFLLSVFASFGTVVLVFHDGAIVAELGAGASEDEIIDATFRTHHAEALSGAQGG